MYIYFLFWRFIRFFFDWMFEIFPFNPSLVIYAFEHQAENTLCLFVLDVDCRFRRYCFLITHYRKIISQRPWMFGISRQSPFLAYLESLYSKHSTTSTHLLIIMFLNVNIISKINRKILLSTDKKYSIPLKIFFRKLTLLWFLNELLISRKSNLEIIKKYI